MAIYYLLLILSAVGTAGNFAVTKVYQKNMGNGAREGILFNIFIGLFSSIIFFVASGFRMEFSVYSLVMAGIVSLLIGLYTVIGFKIMSMGSMTVYTVFLMLGGAMVPYIYGILFLKETVTVARIAAMLLVAIAIILNTSGSKGEKQSVRFILLCLAVFFINGGVSVFSKLHQIETVHKTVSPESFVVLKNVTRFVLFAMLLPIFGKKSEGNVDFKLSWKIVFVMLMSAIISNVAYILQLIGASHLDASMLYPVVTGGSIVATSLFDRICFKQKLSSRTAGSIVVCIVALILFML